MATDRNRAAERQNNFCRTLADRSARDGPLQLSRGVGACEHEQHPHGYRILSHPLGAAPRSSGALSFVRRRRAENGRRQSGLAIIQTDRKRKRQMSRIKVRKLPLGQFTNDGAFWPMVDGENVGEDGRCFWPTEDEARAVAK